MIVKEFKVPAANQEAILAAFQEEGWVPRIDDPLAPQLNQDSKRWLHDTINSLNRNQKHELDSLPGRRQRRRHPLGIRPRPATDPQRPADEVSGVRSLVPPRSTHASGGCRWLASRTGGC